MIRQYKAGEDVDLSWAEFWFNLIRQSVADGKRFERVRVVSIPPSEYTSVGLWMSQFNIGAGEDIRYLRRDVAQGLDLPDHDYWLFDSRKLVKMHFGEDDRFLGGEIVTDAAEVVQHNYWQDVAQHHAIKRDEFIAENEQQHDGH